LPAGERIGLPVQKVSHADRRMGAAATQVVGHFWKRIAATMRSPLLKRSIDFFDRVFRVTRNVSTSW
jgi:hypothetical protein